MLHFSCDLCGQPLDDERFVAKVEVYPAFDPDELSEQDLDLDHLEEVAALIQEMEAEGKTPSSDCDPKQFRFDLCAECRERYLRDPLGREALRRLNFSEN